MYTGKYKRERERERMRVSDGLLGRDKSPRTAEYIGNEFGFQSAK